MRCIKLLQTILKTNGIDAYIVPKNDQFFSEYSSPDRLKQITNFSGSAGLAIIFIDKNYLFVDGRYIHQAAIQAGVNFRIFEISKISVKSCLAKEKKFLNIGYDPKLFTKNFINNNTSENVKFIPIKRNLIDSIFKTKVSHKSKNYFFLNNKSSGESSKNKIYRLIKILNKIKVDNIFISAPENVAWLLNMRGYDNPYSPIPNCQVFLDKKKNIILFAEIKGNLKNKIKRYFPKIKFYSKKDFSKVVKKLSGKNFFIDKKTCSIFDENQIKDKFSIFKGSDPCYLLKSKKNYTEIKNTQKIHIEDGLALTRFIYYIKKHPKKFNEISLEKLLEKFRRKSKKYLYPSFGTISASGPNSSIIHYKATKSSCRSVKENDIYLIDSGGQYKFGTTDVTRTICFNKPSLKIRNLYTRVLKGHIAVATHKLKNTDTGSTIDKKARYWLKQINLDYSHGTGHGVGYFLNVHEGPQSISPINRSKFTEGMILSNEPGYYKKNYYGFRIENLIYVKKKGNKLFFENLTLAPYDNDLINFRLLNTKEKRYISNYHKNIFQKIGSNLNVKEKQWLLSLV